MTDLTIVLTGAAADRVRKLVAEEHYSGPAEAVADALDALEANRDPELDRWLSDTIVTRAEAFAADPTRSLTPDQVRARLSPR